MNKIKNLISRQTNRSREEYSPTDEKELGLDQSEPVYKYKEVREFPSDPLAEAEVINSIEQVYFSDETFDSSQYELEKLAEDEKPSLIVINEDRDRLRAQLQAVSKKVSDVVLENHSAYTKELQRVTDLQASLQTANVICTNGRRQLEVSKQGFTISSLSIMANYRKKQQLLSLMKSLHTIKTLQRTDIRLREMLEEEDYPGAIQLCLECQKAASTFRHYTCISELSSKLQDTLEMIEEQLDQALAKTCNTFDTSHYQKVQRAYRLLGKTQTAMDQLHMHFTSAIHNTAFTIVLGYVELVSGSSDTRFQKMQYKDLCSYITGDTFIPCMVDLCKALWDVMRSYYKTMEWHEDFESEVQTPETEADTGSISSNVEASFNRKYIQKKLAHGLSRIWQDVQQKVKFFLLGTDLSFFKYDDFIFVLDIINRLILIGEEFCGSKSEDIQKSIRTQTINYFKNYHRARMDELCIFLENEGWELCPVRVNFSIHHLQEFKFMQLLNSQRTEDNMLEIDKLQMNVFKRFETGSPFDRQILDDTEDVIQTVEMNNGDGGHSSNDDSDSDVPDELKQDFIDEQTGENPTKRKLSQVKKRPEHVLGREISPILANTTLNVLRLVGKYMQMMSVLTPIAYDVVLCMSQLFDYYLYAVFTFFTSDVPDVEKVLNSKLLNTLKRISNEIIDQSPQGAPRNPDSPNNKVKVAFPYLSPIVDLENINSLYGLSERIVATESLAFLAEQFESLQSHLESVIPASKKPFLQQFYSQTVGVSSELRKAVYLGVSSCCLETEKILNLMSTVNWNVKDIMSQHSPYVDALLQDLQVFRDRLRNVGKQVRIPQVVYVVLWNHLILIVNRTVVEGLAGAKKCSNEGRALMQLDYQQFLMKLEQLTDIKPIPAKEFVETYIKAFYLSEADMECWVKEHREYSGKQLTSLINCAVSSKRGRQRLLMIIEELERQRPR
ncbi:syndetin-like [Anneissia japonica]|uniref:syndetin-like n=1 Tax=Anneissia japonica TaxID=1529436 RepID=UPI00142596A6|nr:syndetin-like [Anneissia japonica]